MRKMRRLPLHKGQPFGEIMHADFKRWLAEPDVGQLELRKLLAQNGLLVFRKADLTPAEEVAMNKLFGYHDESADAQIGAFGGWNSRSSSESAGLGFLPSQPEVLCQGNALVQDHHGIESLQLKIALTYENEGWHADGVHNMQTQLPVLTSMYCLKAPIAGGGTFFTCGRRTLSDLDPGLRELCRRITVHYVYHEARGCPIVRDGIVREGYHAPSGTGATSNAAAVRTAHPLVRRLDETGEESVYISCANIERMAAPRDDARGLSAVVLDEAASYDFVRTILGRSTSAPAVYEHRWRAGDWVIWDNRLVLHAPGRAGTCVGERFHHRVRLNGSAAANADLIEHSIHRDPASADQFSPHSQSDELTWNHISARLPTAHGAYDAASAGSIARLEELGYCVLPGVIPAEAVGAVRASVMATTATYRNPNAPPTIGHVPGLIKHDQSFAPYLASRAVMDVVEAIFGTDAKITFTTGQTNHPGCERQEWHSDWPFNQSGSAHVRAPYADAVMHLTALWMLDEMTDETGTILLPGTHKAAVNPSVAGVHDPMTPHPHEVRATGKAGSVLLIDSRLWHAIPPNPTSSSRVAFAVRYAPWFFDTSVVMPGSAARARIVDGSGRPVDVGSSHAGIPLGDPAQPAVPLAVFERLLAAGGGAKATAALYEHWLPPVSPPPVPTHHGTPTPVPTDVLDDASLASEAMRRSGFMLVRDAVDAQRAAGVREVFSVPAAAEAGLLSAPSVLALAEHTLGAYFRISDIRPVSHVAGSAAELRRAWPHASGIAPCASTPPLARLHAQAAMALHAFVAQEACTLLVQPLDQPDGAPARRSLVAGDVAVIDSRIAFCWLPVPEKDVSTHGGSIMASLAQFISETATAVDGAPFSLRVSFSPWWFDASALAEGSLHRSRLLDAQQAGSAVAPAPARPPLELSELSDSTVWDLLQHWEVEQGGDAHRRVLKALCQGRHDERCAASLAACPFDLLGTYGRIWALQQVLQCGLFDLIARTLSAGGPDGMGSRSFMAAKVRVDERAPYLLPVLVAAAVVPNTPILLLAHVANVWLHGTRAPFLWDHEYWDMLTELIVIVAMAVHLADQAGGTRGGSRVKATATARAGGAPPANRVIAWSAPAVRTAMIIFYSAAAFWKFNTSFFDPFASCAPIFVTQLLAAYLPSSLLAAGTLTDVIVWTAPHLAASVEVAIPLLLSQSSRPLLRYAGLGLGLLFHFLIALTPPPNNAGGFSVGAVVRYFFFMPVATSAACHLFATSSSLASSAGELIGLRRSKVAPRHELTSLALAGAIAAAIVTAASQGSITLQGSLPVFMAVGIVYLRALGLAVRGLWSRWSASASAACTAFAATSAPLAASSPARGVPARPPRLMSVANLLLLSLAAVYAFGLPILGLQDIAACGMFANMHFVTTAYTGSNHFVVPTGLLQAHYEHASAADNPFAGGVVQVVHTTSSVMRHLFPAESTSMLSPQTRDYLAHAGHSAREFGPSTTRVVGTLPGMRPEPNASKPQLQYLLPADELRRLLAEARERREPFTLTYKRVSTTGAPFAGRVVDVTETYSAAPEGGGSEDDGGASGSRRTHCTVRANVSALSTECEPDELALLPASGWWSTGLLLAFPLPMRDDGVHEVGCLA